MKIMAELLCGSIACFNFQSSLFNEALPLTLPLLMAGVRANDPNNALPPDN